MAGQDEPEPDPDRADDEDYLEEVIPAPEFGGTFNHPGTERRVGVEATLKF